MNIDLLIPLGIFTLVGGIILAGILSERKRTRNLEELSERLKMRFQKTPEPDLLNQHAAFHLFTQGHSKKISNVMERSIQDLHTLYFDYKYVTGSGKSSSTHTQSVLSISNPAFQAPLFFLTPENFLHRLAQKLTGNDIDFESHPAFNKLFQLKGDDEEALRKLFSEDVIRCLEEDPGRSIEASGPQMIFYNKRTRCSVKQVEEFIRHSLETYNVFIQQK